VKNVTGDKGRRLGYYVNVLYEIKRYLEKRRGKLTEAQIRLITKRLEKIDVFEDVYRLRGSTQKSMFTRAVAEYTGLSCSFVVLPLSLLNRCKDENRRAEIVWDIYQNLSDSKLFM
jgi:hypothetical protein